MGGIAPLSVEGERGQTKGLLAMTSKELRRKDLRHEKEMAHILGYDVKAWIRYWCKTNRGRPWLGSFYMRAKTDTGFQRLPSKQELYRRNPPPAEIVEAILDKQCPSCGADTHQTRVKKDGSVRRGGFDIGYDEHGRVFGARCSWCGWSF